MNMRIVLCLIVILMTLEKSSGQNENSYESVIDNSKSAIEKYKQLQIYYKRNVELKDKLIETLTNSIIKLERQIDNCNMTSKYQKELSDEFSNKLTAENNRVHHFNQTLIETQQKLYSSEKTILALEQQLKDNKTELDAKNKDISEKGITIQDQLIRIKILETERDENKIKIRSLESNLDICTNEIQTKNQETTELKTQLNLSTAKINEQNEIITSNLTTCKASSCEAYGTSSSIHTIQVPGVDPFKVLCDGHLNGTGWTVIQRRINGSVSFYQSWTEYKNGFGNLTGEFFIGLEKLHHMTKAEPQELYIHLEDYEGQTRYAKYDKFEVGSEQESYALKSLGSFEGTVSDQLRLNEGEKFSTFDRKNDRSFTNCAVALSGGWWYSKCGLTNLNGVYLFGDTVYDTYGKGIFWDDDDWHDTNYSLKTVQIMIRARKA
ncbi:angiopoietin-related protein 7-like [Drosophila innubila]|uniref:angiopoietin-related protein 7-like n=1 Tax=Drosophila innubila TaxID=198719 RepID=UPI00148B518F|nr:angiopoietin-related protein 7-like [Drosophila innubila]